MHPKPKKHWKSRVFRGEPPSASDCPWAVHGIQEVSGSIPLISTIRSEECVKEKH